MTRAPWLALSVLVGWACSSTSSNPATSTGGTAGTGATTGGSAGQVGGGTGGSSGTDAGGSAGADAGSPAPILEGMHAIDDAEGANDVALAPNGHVLVLGAKGGGKQSLIAELETGVGEVKRRTFASTTNSFLMGLSVDGGGLIYVSGFYVADLDIWGDKLTEPNAWGAVAARLVPPVGDAGTADAVVTSEMKGTGNQVFWGNAPFGSGSVNVGRVEVGGGQLHTQTIPGTDAGDAVLSLDFGGQASHVVFGGTGFQTFYRVASDMVPHIYAAGESPAVPALSVLGTGQQQLAVVVSYNANLELRWAKGMGSATGAVFYDVASNPVDKQIVAVGSASGLVDPGTVSSQPNKGGEDVLVACFGEDGALLWVRTFGGSAQDRAWSVAVHQSGDILVGGFTRSPSIDLGAVGKLTKQGDRDGLLLRLDSKGELRWAGLFGGAGIDGIDAVASSDGRTIAVGAFEGPFEFLGQNIATVPDAGTNKGIAVLELGL